MNLFTYEIAAPTNVVEASASPEPDDVSMAYVRIEATATKDVKKGAISAIRFEINVPELQKPAEDATEQEKEVIEKSNDQKRQAALTRNPGNITPVAAAFRRWTFSAPIEKNIFVAKPNDVTDDTDDQTLVIGGEVLVFYLYDIEVIDRDGETKIKVTEFDGAGKDTTAPELEIRKIFPALRIDYFKAADKLAVKAGTQVQLEWATTSATEIWLSGIADTDTALNKTVTMKKISEPDTYRLEGLKDGTFSVRPETTTTYTLQARSNNANTVALQQLTITVMDKLVVPLLVSDQLAIANEISVGNGNVTIKNNEINVGNGMIKSGDIFAGTIHSSEFISANDIEASNINSTGGIFTGRGAVPVGTIALWSNLPWDGSPDFGHPRPKIPNGWALCDGRTLKSETPGQTHLITLPDLSSHSFTIVGGSVNYIMFLGKFKAV